MNKGLLFLMLMFVGGLAFAQPASVESKLWEQVDPAAEWGKWVQETVKPYWDQMNETSKSFVTDPMSKLDKNLSADAIAEKAREQLIAYIKGLEAIDPPSELSAYHAKIIELSSESAKFSPKELVQNQELMNKLDALSEEANAELTKVFEGHAVPKKTIDAFIENSLE